MAMASPSDGLVVWRVLASVAYSRRRLRRVLRAGPRQHLIDESLQVVGELLRELVDPPPPQLVRDGGLEKLAALAGKTGAKAVGEQVSLSVTQPRLEPTLLLEPQLLPPQVTTEDKAVNEHVSLSVTQPHLEPDLLLEPQLLPLQVTDKEDTAVNEHFSLSVTQPHLEPNLPLEVPQLLPTQVKVTNEDQEEKGGARRRAPPCRPSLHHRNHTEAVGEHFSLSVTQSHLEPNLPLEVPQLLPPQVQVTDKEAPYLEPTLLLSPPPQVTDEATLLAASVAAELAQRLQGALAGLSPT